MTEYDESVKKAFEASINQNSTSLSYEQIRAIRTITEDIAFAGAVYRYLGKLHSKTETS